jgi:CDGSH-type Zn-finger protein
VSTIRIKPNGPYIITGPVTIEDGDGKLIAVGEGRTVKLCRCGHSATKPFCDGTHRRVDFVSRPTFEPEPILERMSSTWDDD